MLPEYLGYVAACYSFDKARSISFSLGKGILEMGKSLKGAVGNLPILRKRSRFSI